MSKLSRENTNLKLKGAGDGLKNLTRSSERIPFPSSRKFTPTLRKNESVQIKLKKVLDDLEATQGRLKKSKTVAEITPTKIRNRKKTNKQRQDGVVSVLHATPRPTPSLDDDAKRTPSGLDAEIEKESNYQRLVYRRLLVFIWRRNKKRLMMITESLRRRQDQVHNLEKQVNCLKSLTQSECHKRGEAMSEYQKMEDVLNKIRMENNSLIAEKVSIQKKLDEMSFKFESANINLENIKNEMNTKNIYLKRLENEIFKEKSVNKDMKRENDELRDKVKSQEINLIECEKNNLNLKQVVENLERKLKDCDLERHRLLTNLYRLQEQLKQKDKSFEDLQSEFDRVELMKENMGLEIENLERKVWEITNEYERVLKVYNDKYWWRNMKEVVKVSWGVLRHAVYLMLPAL